MALRRRSPTDLFLLAWLGSVVVLLYVPFALQRRFITGLHVPLVLLAAMGIEQVLWPRLAAGWRGMVTGLILGAGALTTLFVPLVAVLGVAQGGNPLVMSEDEAAAYAWLAENTVWTDTVLAPVASGQFVPAWAGNRVVYGHPFETIDAEEKRAEVDRFYDPGTTPAERRALLERYRVRLVLSLSPGMDAPLATLGWRSHWTQGSAAIYSGDSEP
jgi:alpha-1,6-mannosyltransferase